MKTTKIIAFSVCISNLAILAFGGPVVTVQVPAPAVQVQVPAPALTIEAVPETYIWDGDEYVGMVGTDYYYLGPGDVWMRLDAPRLARFHDWEKLHADWRDHAIRNEHYRRDAHENGAPIHDEHPHDVKSDAGHDSSPNNVHEKDHDAGH